jgi:hypothetical protein
VQYLFGEKVQLEPTIKSASVHFSSVLIYSFDMTKLLEEAIDRLRQLPAPMQDSAARVLIMQLEEEPEPGDLVAIAEGRLAYERGEVSSLDQWRHDVGVRNN